MSDKQEPRNAKEAFAMALAEFLTSQEGQGFARHMLRLNEIKERLGLTDEQFGELYLLGGEDLQRFTARTNRRNASKDRRKQWAVDLAHDLKQRHSTFPQAWESISEDDFKIYRTEDDKGREAVRFSDPEEGDDQLTKEAFRTGYFVKAKGI